MFALAALPPSISRRACSRALSYASWNFEDRWDLMSACCRSTWESDEINGGVMTVPPVRRSPRALVAPAGRTRTCVTFLADTIRDTPAAAIPQEGFAVAEKLEICKHPSE